MTFMNNPPVGNHPVGRLADNEPVLLDSVKSKMREHRGLPHHAGHACFGRKHINVERLIF
jgi:hypothetical protein